MPYKMRKQNGEYCVFNSDTGENKGCSKTKPQAIKHMRAMYAAEGGAKMGKKEVDILVTKSYMDFIADPDTSDDLDFEELAEGLAEEPEEAEVQAAETITTTAVETTMTVSGAADNTLIPTDPPPVPPVSESAAAETVPEKSIRKNTRERLVNFVKGLLSWAYETMPEEELPPEKRLMVWKEANGDYHWAARYSNNFRDQDNPPEIISAKSHQRFVELVDKGLASMPELWLWHVKEWKFGEANWLAYDDSGFALAAGTIDKDKSFVAEWLAERDDFQTSHGMPYSSLQRDPVDPSIIKEHVTVEISPLPGIAAANKLTDFIIPDGYMNKENTMAIPAHKRQTLIEMGFKPELLDKLEALNAETKSKAEEAGLESKETTPEEQPAPPAPAEVKEETTTTEEVTTETVVTEPAQVETPAPEQSPLTRAEVAEAVANVIGGKLADLEGLVSQLDTSLKTITADVASLKEKTAIVEKAAEAATDLPAASMAAILAQRLSAIGSKETHVDGRSSLARSKPKEAPAQNTGRLGIPFLDTMLDSHPNNEE